MKRQRLGGRRQGPEAGGYDGVGHLMMEGALCVKDAELCPCFPGECPKVSSASQDIQGGQSASQLTPRPALKGKHGCLKADSVRAVRSGGGRRTRHVTSSQAGESELGLVKVRAAQRAGFSSNDIRKWWDHRLTVVKYLIIDATLEALKAKAREQGGQRTTGDGLGLWGAMSTAAIADLT